MKLSEQDIQNIQRVIAELQAIMNEEMSGLCPGDQLPANQQESLGSLSSHLSHARKCETMTLDEYNTAGRTFIEGYISFWESDETPW